jgi:crotonobetainyl-CoA:carnitine CoA-transferase CaiB-like acyl-CoA transferase
VEAGIHLCGPVLLETSVNGRVTRESRFPTGNRLEYPNAAPHAVYPCAGEDRWIAIAVFGDDEWRALLEVMGRPAWGDDARFATQADRFANQDALDDCVGAWTARLDCHAAMNMLQRAGVRAGAVQNARDLNEFDPQLACRGLFFEMDHPVIGEARFEGEPMKFSRTRADLWRSAPLLGEDNGYVYREILGLSEADVADLASREVI